MKSETLSAEDLAAEIRDRAETSSVYVGGSGTKGLYQMASLARPSADSPSRLKRKLKMSILRLINWQIDPVADQVTGLQRATTEAVQDLESRIEKLEGHN